MINEQSERFAAKGGYCPSFYDCLPELAHSTDSTLHTTSFSALLCCCVALLCGLQVRQLMEKMDMDHDGNVGGDEFLATLIDWGQVGWLVGAVD
jgi:hypothetical protein